MRIPSDRTEFMDFCRAGAMAVNVGDGRLLCRVLGAKPFYCWAKDLSITPHLAMSGFFDPDLTCFLVRTVQPGWRWADIGANVGYFSVLLAELTHNAAGHAYEPEPVSFSCLQANLRTNACQDTIGHEVAIGVIAGRRHLRVAYECLGGSSLLQTPYISEFTCRDVMVSVRPFTEGVDFLKIDAEGMDIDIVNSLNPKPPHVVCEYGLAWGYESSLSKLFAEWHVALIGEGGRLEEAKLDSVRNSAIVNLYLQPK
jgi:FkbM family methyltransferase